MANKNRQIAEQVLPLVGGKENVQQATHCMTRLRLNLYDYEKAQLEELKKISGVLKVLTTGGQLQIVIGTNVDGVYDEFCNMTGIAKAAPIDETLDQVAEKKKLTGKEIVNNIFGYLSGSLTPMIPVLIAASLCKTIVAVFGPQLLGVMPAESDLYKLFTMLGDAGFYFMPVILGATAAIKLGMNMVMGIYVGAILLHPTLIGMAAEQTAFTVYGIPCSVQNYSSTVLPILMIVWVMSYIEKFLKKVCPDVIKVMAVPLGTLLVITPIALCVLGPAGAFLGNYISSGVIALYSVAGPVAVAILGGFFGLLVCTGMHQVLMVYLFTTFPMVGFDAFLMPGILASSWAGAGVALACIVKFKKPENKSMVINFFTTWLLGGVGEPMLYGLNLRYRTSLYASVIAGAVAGFVAGLIGLKAYVLNPSNGIYGIAAFLGGSNGNYIALAVTIAVAVIGGFLVMILMPLKEE